MHLLKVSGIHVVENDNQILKDVSFTQQAFQKIAIAGETGSGKSTLLQTIAGLVQPASGTVYFEDEQVIGPHDVLVPGHDGIAYLSQQYELPQFLRVEQVLQYANTLSGDEAAAVYDICRISPLLKRRTNQLSGGEKQRIALAKLLISSPRLLLLDEPYSNLDVSHKTILKSVIDDISNELDITCILISHDPADTLSWADQIMVMKAGEMLQQGTPEQIYRKPANEYVGGLFGKYNLVSHALANSLTGFREGTISSNNFLIRPERFRVVAKADGGIQGIVKKINYYGSHFEAEVLLANSIVTVKMLSCNFQEGEKVFVAVAPEDIWPV